MEKIEEIGQSGEAYLTRMAEVLKREVKKYFSCQDLKSFFSRKTRITNCIKRHIKSRDKLFQLWDKSKSERAHLKYKNRRNEVNMEFKMAKRRDLQKTGDLNNLQTWLALKKVVLNFLKSKFVIYEKQAKFYGNIELDEQIIAAFVSYKYLGNYFDKKLNSDVHIGKVIQKLWKHCRIV